MNWWDISAWVTPSLGLLIWWPMYRRCPQIRPWVLIYCDLFYTGLGLTFWVREHDWLYSAGGAANIIAGVLWLFWRSRKRKRAQAWIGAKSRALRDAVVRKMREQLQPRPIPVPLPGR